MTEIVDRADVVRILTDPTALVPEPESEPGADSPVGRFRAAVSRFANGPEHHARRATLQAMLDDLDPAQLAGAAASRTRAELARVHAAGVEAAGARAAVVVTCARRVPVATLADALGFTDPDALPALVATLATVYQTGAESADADAAVIVLLEAADGHDETARALRVQLLVQAFAATFGLIVKALALADRVGNAHSTHQLLDTVLREEPPVPVTRRVLTQAAQNDDEHGTRELVALRLDGPDRDALVGDLPARVLAFGAGPRACPAPHHALALAAAILDTVRADTEEATSDAHAE